MRPTVTKLYQIFKSYRPCVESELPDELLQTPLRQLTVEQLSEYSFKAMTTRGDQNDFRHFLPRIFELVINGDPPSDREVVIGKFGYAEWSRWRKREREVVYEYLEDLWRVTLASPYNTQGSDCVAEEILCGIGCASVDLSPFLDHWASSRDSESVRHLACFICWSSESIRKSQSLSNAFWSKCRQQELQVLDWLQSEVVRGLVGASVAFLPAELALAPHEISSISAVDLAKRRDLEST